MTANSLVSGIARSGSDEAIHALLHRQWMASRALAMTI
jgi:hypothetical protein